MIEGLHMNLRVGMCNIGVGRSEGSFFKKIL